jgi:hypothetical protein
MSTFFQDISGLYKGPQTGATDSLQQLKVFPGHVLDICLDENSPLYESNRDIGKIRFRDLVREYNKEEQAAVKTAYPLDRSIARYPMPGEEVIIFRAFGETTSTKSLVLANIYFYSFVVSTMHNVSYNANPFIGTDKYHIDKKNPFMSYDQAKRRLEGKIKNGDAVVADNKPIVHKQLKPYEGDFILQGRFGTSIRQTATLPKADNPWKSSGTAGDGLIIIRADRETTNKESDMLTQEDINKDDASIYVCTSQKIELELACSKSIRSWAMTYDIPAHGSEAAKDTFATITNTAGLWQKAVETDKPLDQAFQSPASNTNGESVNPPTTPTPNTQTTGSN